MAFANESMRDGQAGVGRHSRAHGPPHAEKHASARLAGKLVPPDRARLSVARLSTLRPDLSSATLLWPWQRVVLVAFATALLASLILAPVELAVVVTLVLTVPFFAVYLLRLLALGQAFGKGRAEAEARGAKRLPDAALPSYAVLVALYDEAQIVPGLVKALCALDYPTDRLAIRLVVEEDDASTRAALARQTLPPHITVLAVPRGSPRTKPRALTIALDQTPGECVVVYDAEDLPERDQLRRAAYRFATSPKELACVQARLNTFNHGESWLARQFTIEYSALFDLILPFLERFGLPVPLGGTSNHFRREALQRSLAWDPYNVTEDADLGIRLARFGMRVGTIGSTTWEEAPVTFRVWLGQRTRWLKGWMQTYIVHMRRPVRLFRELGWWQFFGFQALMSAMLASALVHPWFYVLLGYEALRGDLFSGEAFAGNRVMWWLALGNLALGYLSVVCVGALAVWRRGRRGLMVHTLLVPVYWLAISLAAYRALGELVRAPFHWEKTRHRARVRRKKTGAVQRVPAGSGRNGQLGKPRL